MGGTSQWREKEKGEPKLSVKESQEKTPFARGGDLVLEYKFSHGDIFSKQISKSAHDKLKQYVGKLEGIKEKMGKHFDDAKLNDVKAILAKHDKRLDKKNKIKARELKKIERQKDKLAKQIAKDKKFPPWLKEKIKNEAIARRERLKKVNEKLSNVAKADDKAFAEWKKNFESSLKEVFPSLKDYKPTLTKEQQRLIKNAFVSARRTTNLAKRQELTRKANLIVRKAITTNLAKSIAGKTFEKVRKANPYFGKGGKGKGKGRGKSGKTKDGKGNKGRSSPPVKAREEIARQMKKHGDIIKTFGQRQTMKATIFRAYKRAVRIYQKKWK